MWRGHWRSIFKAYIQDGPIAVGAAWGEEIVIIRLTVRLSVTLKEVLGAKFLATVGTGEVLWMPGLGKSSDHLEKKRTWHWTLRMQWNSWYQCFTCPTMGLLHAAQQPFWAVLIPWRLISDWRVPSMESRWLLLWGCCPPGCPEVLGLLGLA